MVRGFPLNPHQLIGFANPTNGGSFSHHTVAWAGACGENDVLFDACLQLDSDSDPSTSLLSVPTNIRFGQRHEKFYRFRLTSDQDQCRPDPPKKALRRRIGFPKLKSAAVVRQIILIEKLPVDRSESTQIFNQLVAAFISEQKRFVPWKFQDLYFLDDPDAVFSTQSFWRQADADEAIRIDASVSPSVPQARRRLKQLLSSFELRDIKQQEQPKYGNVVYSVPENFVIVFSRREFVFRLRNVGKSLVSTERFAQVIDNFLTSRFQNRTAGKSVRRKESRPKAHGNHTRIRKAAKRTKVKQGG
jgi:hypothetical protein